jgi:amicyanin
MPGGSMSSGRLIASGLLGALTGVCALVAVGQFAPTTRAEATEGTAVKIDNFTFSPPTLKVKVGTTVTWKNEDDIPHTVVATDKTFKSGALDTDDSYSFTFTTVGAYEYFCSLHPHMTGKIEVEAQTGNN